MLTTPLTNVEREYIHKRIAQERIELERLTSGYNCIGRLERRHGGMIERMGPSGLFDLPKPGFNVIAIPTFEGK